MAFPFHLSSLLDPRVPGISVDHGLMAVEKLCSWGQIMHVGRGRFDRVD
jgi:hypothetical protein